MHPAVFPGRWVWPCALRWLGLAVCALRGHRKAKSVGMVDGRETVVYCGRCRTFLYTASTYGSTW